MIWSYIVLSYLTLFLYGLADNIRGPLLPELIHFFSLSNTQGSLIFALSSGLAFFASYKSGRVMHLMGLNKSLIFAVFLMALGYLVVGLAPSFVVVLVGICFFGLSMGLLGVIQNIMASLGSPVKIRSQIMAGLHSMYGLSSLFAPMLVTWNYKYLESGWRSTFLVVSGLAFITLAGSIIALFRSRFQEPVVAPPKEDKESALISWIAGFVLAAYVVAEILVSSRLALFTREVHGANLEESSNYLSWFFLLLLGGRLLFAVVPLNFSRAKILGVSLVLSVIFCVLGVQSHPWLLAASGLTMSVFYPFAITYITEKFKENAFSAIAKAVTLQGLCVVIMHLGVGYLTDVLGIQKALYFGIIFLGLSGLSLFLCERMLANKARA